VTSLGSAIFAFVAAGVFDGYEQAQDALCPSYRKIEPDPASAGVYDQLFELYRKLYFGLGNPESGPVQIGDVLPRLRKIAAEVRG